jgi:hypothetical protein
MGYVLEVFEDMIRLSYLRTGPAREAYNERGKAAKTTTLLIE